MRKMMLVLVGLAGCAGGGAAPEYALAGWTCADAVAAPCAAGYSVAACDGLDIEYTTPDALGTTWANITLRCPTGDIAIRALGSAAEGAEYNYDVGCVEGVSWLRLTPRTDGGFDGRATSCIAKDGDWTFTATPQ